MDNGVAQNFSNPSSTIQTFIQPQLRGRPSLAKEAPPAPSKLRKALDVLQERLEAPARMAAHEAWLKTVERALESAAQPILERVEKDHTRILDEITSKIPHHHRHCDTLKARGRLLLHSLGRLRERVYEAISQISAGYLSETTNDVLLEEIREGGLQLVRRVRALEESLGLALGDAYYQEYGHAD